LSEGFESPRWSLSDRFVSIAALDTYAFVQTDHGLRPYHSASVYAQGDRVASSTATDNTVIDSSATDSTLAFVFPGQGSQSVAMLAELAEAYPSIRRDFEEASEGAGVDLWMLSQQGPEEQLNRTEYTQPALLAAGVAVWRLWQAHGGPTPTILAGHSLGEYSALVAAGALSLAQAAHLVRIRGQLMQAASPEGSGAMAAVIGVDDDVVREVCAEVSGSEIVVPANFNSPGQIVIGGHAAAVDRASELLTQRGARKVARLAVSVPSHTPLMRDAANRLAEAMHGLDWREPAVPVVQNVDAQAHRDVQAVRDALVRQLYMPVLWTVCVQALATRGVLRIAECGPGKVLCGLNKRIDKSLEHRALGSLDDFTAALAAWNLSPETN
jgi:[acyl-carrier-protein] S-malonyltransferase